MRVAGLIEQKLTEAFKPEMLTVTDESYKHAGHAGARPEGESHFHVHIVADFFNGMSRVKRQQAIYKVLSEEMKSDIHALALLVKGSDE